MSAADSLTGRMAAEAVALWQDGVPAEVLEKAALCLADAFSGACESAPLEHAQQAARVAERAGGEAAMIATGAAAVPGDAAFANAVAAHGLVREDMHTGSVAHFGVVVWPALLAAASLRFDPVTGRELLTAGAIGYEVGGRVGRAMMTPELARLFRPTGLFGPLAAATATGLLLGLDAERLASAMAFGINAAAGFNEWPNAGGADMFFHAGFAAQNGLRAARLAEAGAFGSPSVLEGPAGMFRAVARGTAPGEIALAPADEPYEIQSVFHKSIPGCNYAQTPGQAALEAGRRFAGGPEEIAEVRVTVTEAAMAYPGCDRRGPFGNVLQAKMSIRFAVATALLNGEITERGYADPGDARIAALIERIELVPDAGLTAAYPARQGARVTIRGTDGSETEAALDDVQVAGPQEVRDRLAYHAALAMGQSRADRLLSVLKAVEGQEDIRTLNTLCRRDGTQPT